MLFVSFFCSVGFFEDACELWCSCCCDRLSPLSAAGSCCCPLLFLQKPSPLTPTPQQAYRPRDGLNPLCFLLLLPNLPKTTLTSIVLCYGRECLDVHLTRDENLYFKDLATVTQTHSHRNQALTALFNVFPPTQVTV